MKARETFIASAVGATAALVLAPVLPDVVAVGVAVGASFAAVALGRRWSRPGVDDEASAPLASISHEIRTPLNGILGLTQLLMRMQPTTQQREYLEAIKSSGISLLRLMNDILDHSKISSGSLAFVRETFPLRKWVRETVRGLAPQAHLAGLELAFWVEPDVPDDLIGDPHRLRQVLTNLLVNAIKYTSEGEVALAVCLESFDDDVAVVRFRVSDTGVGVPDGQRRTIFDAFAQGHRTTAGSGGVGLGLTIARDLVEQMGGDIGLETSPGGGSTFHFAVGFAVPRDGVRGDDAALTDPLPGFNVLVVDDSPAQRTALEKQMKAWGFSVVTASDDASSLAAVDRDGPFSFLLVDSHIPGVDVWALATKLQEINPAPGVLMTLAHEHVDTERLRAHGFYGHLTKPLAPTHLLRAIEIIRRGASVEAPEDVQTHNMDRLALGGIRVLLAEDNAVNRTVVVSMLERIGCEVSAAGDGREALDLVTLERAEPFDLALVDLQMPEMDGAALARAIRAREGASGDHLPIIAITAHAREADRDLCRAAGMDAFVSKPFQEDELVSVMRRCLAEAKRDVIDPRFDRVAALVRANGDVSLLAELAGLFLEETPETVSAIRAALAASDTVTVERLAHRIKGALLTLSAERAAKLALRLETMARSSSREDCEPVLERLASELERLAPELESLSASVES